MEFDNGESERADAVIMAMPSLHAARLLKGIDGSLSEAVGSIRYASSIVLNLLFKREQIPNPLDGFGFVVPAIEKRSIIACSYSSIKFANRAPEGFVMLRAFVGGALRAELNQLSEDQCIKLTLKDLRHYLGIKSAPVWCKLSRWPDTMPQYDVGHNQVVERVKELLQEKTTLKLAGNGYEGVGIPDCIRSGNQAALSLLNHVLNHATVQ